MKRRFEDDVQAVFTTSPFHYLIQLSLVRTAVALVLVHILTLFLIQTCLGCTAVKAVCNIGLYFSPQVKMTSRLDPRSPLRHPLPDVTV
jgi:hypothetical protein